MKEKLWSMLLGVVESRFQRGKADCLSAWVCRMVKKRAASMPPAEALRFLFGVDAEVRACEEETAIRYGEGLHTKHRHMRYHAFFTERIGKGERVLDVGCGQGAVAIDIAETCEADVVGIDLNEQHIRMARERHAHPRVRYVLGNALEALPEATFDVVVLSNVLEHLPGRPAFLRRLIVRTEATRLLVRVPLFERDWMVPLRKEVGTEWRLDLTHETEYTQESFLVEMKEAGLGVTHQETRWGEIWAEVRPRVDAKNRGPRGRRGTAADLEQKSSMIGDQ